MEFYNKPLTTGEAAQAFRVSLKTIQQWVDRGLLECWKTPGGHRRISPESMASLQARLNAWSFTSKLLVVCDDKHRSAECIAMLRDISPEQEVREVNNGLEAMLQLVRWHPDIVVFDSPVAGVDFDLMVTTIKQDRELARVQIVLLTEPPAFSPAPVGELIIPVHKTAVREEMKQQLSQIIARPAGRMPYPR